MTCAVMLSASYLARLPSDTAFSFWSDHASFESHRDVLQNAVAIKSAHAQYSNRTDSGSGCFARYSQTLDLTFNASVQPINRDPIKSSMLSSPFLPPFLVAGPSNLTFLPFPFAGSGDVASLFVEAVVLGSPMMRSITFAFAPARFTRSSKSATSTSVLAVLNVGGSVRW
jgi:hypothetical protein